MIMFAEDGGHGDGFDPSGSGSGSISREQLDSCRDSARRAERIARDLAALPPESFHADVTNELAWAILAHEGDDAEEDDVEVHFETDDDAA
ncbi:MAG: hypothetical protein AAF389_13175 [Gemmatimonadota bacterium]